MLSCLGDKAKGCQRRDGRKEARDGSGSGEERCRTSRAHEAALWCMQ